MVCGKSVATFLWLVVGATLVFSGCGGGSCEVPNPEYDPTLPGSPPCLDTSANTLDTSANTGASGSAAAAASLTVSGVSFTLAASTEVDDSVKVLSSDSGAPLEVIPGSSIKIIVPFEAVNGNVVGVGVQFGDTGVIQVVEVPGAAGQTSGTMEVDVDVPDSVCDNLSQICHDIKCYEFAVTDAGNISKANINSIALKCGNCSEPSCQDLLTSCQEEDACDGTCEEDEICLDGECVTKTAATSCEERGACCAGQDNSCTAESGAQCFCDEYCVTAGDCCADACSFCGYCQ